MRKNHVFNILGILAGLNILAWIAVWELGQDGLEVTFFDVGQGDAAFIEMPGGQQILIDGGPSSVILEKLGKEMPFWDRTIDLIILTHPEHDHMAGLLEVLKRYEVENILWTGVLRDTAEYEEWIKLLQEEGAKIYIAESGMMISGSPASSGKPGFLVLYPFESLESKEVKNTNATSIILRLSYGETSFLFTGDAPKSVESQLLSLAKQLTRAGVLKVGHHGSKTSTSAEFVEAVSPDIAVISAGKDNKYGHPHQEVLDNLSGVKVLRTDLDGDIKIVSNGADYIVKN
ncbi:MAG: MBL fold metallo-hydrolase [Candidatus Nealsonbacteria bacterium]|nr:MBL fold metallo-hydrolase [Candidatus Nealsonbacteria bacterium]